MHLLRVRCAPGSALDLGTQLSKWHLEPCLGVASTPDTYHAVCSVTLGLIQGNRTGWGWGDGWHCSQVATERTSEKEESWGGWRSQCSGRVLSLCQEVGR